MEDLNPQVVPMIAYKDGAAALDWLAKAFGFVEVERILGDDGRRRLLTKDRESIVLIANGLWSGQKYRGSSTACWFMSTTSMRTLKVQSRLER
jgi:uncharacterized glyoxalase superfamily protein PhnB